MRGWSIWESSPLWKLKAQASTVQMPDLTALRLSLVAFQLWRVLEQLAPEIFLNYFFKTGDISMVQLTQKMQKNSKKWKKRQKCIDITLRKWSWRPLWQVGKKSISRFHSPPSPLWYRFGNFPEPSTCLGTLENCQKTKLFCKIWLWKRLKKAVIFSEFWYFFFKKSGKIQKNSKNSKKIKNEPGVMYCLIYIFFRFYFWRFDL